MKQIENVENNRFVSIGSFIEIAIKNSLGKLLLHRPYNEILEISLANGFNLLQIKFSHTVVLNSLPFHHRDPFDRILVAQAQTENLSIITKDSFIKEYHVATIW